MHQCKICITTTGEQKSNHRCICNTLSGKCEICTEQIVEVLGLSEWKVFFFLHDGGWRKGGRGCWSSREGWCIVQAHNELLSPTLQFNLPSRCLDSNSSGLAGSTHTHTPITPPILKKESEKQQEEGYLMARAGHRGWEGGIEGRKETGRVGGWHLALFPSSSLSSYPPFLIFTSYCVPQVQDDFWKRTVGLSVNGCRMKRPFK